MIELSDLMLAPSPAANSLPNNTAPARASPRPPLAVAGPESAAHRPYRAARRICAAPSRPSAPPPVAHTAHGSVVLQACHRTVSPVATLLTERHPLRRHHRDLRTPVCPDQQWPQQETHRSQDAHTTPPGLGGCRYGTSSRTCFRTACTIASRRAFRSCRTAMARSVLPAGRAFFCF